MLKLVFLVAVLVLAVVSASPHARPRSKKSIVQIKHPVHHGVQPHKRSPVRAVRSHNIHNVEHHSPGQSNHHTNKARSVHGPHNVHSGHHDRKKPAAHHPVKRQCHRK